MPWGQSGSTLLPSSSLATLVNGASSSLPGSCPGRGWGLHPSPHGCTPLPGGRHPLYSYPLCSTLQCHPRCHHPSPSMASSSSSSSSTGGGTGHPWGPPGPRVTPSQRQQDEAPWLPCVRWGPFLPREVSSKTSRRKALGGTSSLCGLLLAFRHLQRPRGDSGRDDAPGKQDAGRVCGRRNAEGDGGTGMLPGSLRMPWQAGCASDACQGWVGGSSLRHRARQSVRGYEAAAPGPPEEAPPLWGMHSTGGEC